MSLILKCIDLDKEKKEIDKHTGDESCNGIDGIVCLDIDRGTAQKDEKRPQHP